MILSVIIVVSLSVSCGKNGAGEESTAPETTVNADLTTEAPDTEPQTETEPETEAEPLTEPTTETEPETTDEETEPAPEDTGITALLPENSSEISYDLAKELLTVCTGGGKSQTVSLLNERGFELIEHALAPVGLLIVHGNLGNLHIIYNKVCKVCAHLSCCRVTAEEAAFAHAGPVGVGYGTGADRDLCILEDINGCQRGSGGERTEHGQDIFCMPGLWSRWDRTCRRSTRLQP